MSLWIAPVAVVLLVLWGCSYDIRRFVSERLWRRDERRMQTVLDRIDLAPYDAMAAQIDEVRGLPEARSRGPGNSPNEGTRNDGHGFEARHRYAV